MKNVKKILVVGIVGIVGIGFGLSLGMAKNKDCEFCGETFNNKTSLLNEICDICYGWNEYKGRDLGGILLEFENGEGYYFEGE